MKGEEQLINLMHCRYVDALRDMVEAVSDGKNTETLIFIANKLSTSNVDNYRTKWGKVPKPQKIITIDQFGNILSTDSYWREEQNLSQ